MARHHLINGNIVPFTAEEEAQWDANEAAHADGAFDRAIANLRQDRNRKLAETDFYALSDVTMSAEMTTYRQELRDLPSGLTTVEDVNAVVFPTKPS
tara:strand:- start:132 stop:422 length:291 start_codon:yes stop_codon:yes gene_type:complete